MNSGGTQHCGGFVWAVGAGKDTGCGLGVACCYLKHPDCSLPQNKSSVANFTAATLISGVAPRAPPPPPPPPPFNYSAVASFHPIALECFVQQFCSTYCELKLPRAPEFCPLPLPNLPHDHPALRGLTLIVRRMAALRRFSARRPARRGRLRPRRAGRRRRPRAARRARPGGGARRSAARESCGFRRDLLLTRHSFFRAP